MVVSGLKFRAAEVVAAYKTENYKQVIGYDTDCGFFTCVKKPIIDARTRSIPVFKRHVLKYTDTEKLTAHLESVVLEAVNKAQVPRRLSYAERAVGRVLRIV